MALVIEGLFISKTVTSLQIKVYECYIKQLKPRESLLTYEKSSNEKSSDEDSEASEEDEPNDEKMIKDLVISDIEEDN